MVKDSTYRLHMHRAIRQITGDAFFKDHAYDMLIDIKKAFASVNCEILAQAARAEQFSPMQFQMAMAEYSWLRYLYMNKYTTRHPIRATRGILAGATGAVYELGLHLKGSVIRYKLS
jgi:hypothetical protein